MKDQHEATPIKELASKAKIYEEIAQSTGVSKRNVSLVLKGLESVMTRSICKGSVGKFILPKLFTIEITYWPAKRKRKGVHPLTGEEQIFPAKPAERTIKMKPLQNLQEAVD